MKLTDLYWLAGIIEGEGCIVVTKDCLRLSIEMCDLDVLEKVRELLPSSRLTKRTLKEPNPKHRDRYILHLSGSPMMGLLMTIYPLMSFRRKSKIEEAIEKFKTRRKSPYRGGKFLERHSAQRIPSCSSA